MYGRPDAELAQDQIATAVQNMTPEQAVALKRNFLDPLAGVKA
jgi:hypothetical protein